MKTILVVDDEAKIRDVVVSYLKKEGYTLLEAESGHEALKMIQNQPVDFVYSGPYAAGYRWGTGL
jgi:CheY-like chemotaxis protein